MPWITTAFGPFCALMNGARVKSILLLSLFLIVILIASKWTDDHFPTDIICSLTYVNTLPLFPRSSDHLKR